MKIGNLTRLFEALSRPSEQTNQAKVQNQDQAEQSAAAQSNQAAVQVNTDQERRRAEDVARQEKVDRIKNEVAGKTYKVDSQKVAEALYRELFA